MKLIRKKYSYKDKNGKEKAGFNFYLVTSTGHTIAIKNVFKEGYLVLLYNSEEGNTN